MCSIVSVATPPVPGGAAVAMSMIFTQLSIPMEAMAIALTMNILVDFPFTAVDTLGRHMTLFNIASDLGMVDKA